MVAEIPGKIAYPERAIRVSVVLKRLQGMPGKYRLLVPARPIEMLLEKRLRRVIRAVVEGYQQVRMVWRAIRMEGEGLAPAPDCRRQVKPAVMYGRQEHPEFEVVGAQLCRPLERSDGLVKAKRLGESHPKIAVRVEACGVKARRFAEGGEAVLPLPQVAEDNAKGVAAS